MDLFISTMETVIPLYQTELWTGPMLAIKCTMKLKGIMIPAYWEAELDFEFCFLFVYSYRVSPLLVKG